MCYDQLHHRWLSYQTMSSFVGHSLTALGIYANSEPPATKPSLAARLWPAWLVLVSVAPDIDYLVPYLRQLREPSYGGLRITHSVAVSLILPALTTIVLASLNLPRQTLRRRCLQAAGVGLSHIVMDLLVGVTAIPLLWPFSLQRFALPFGILPSAPAYQINNYYMYRNILIEVGILVPLCAGLYWLRHSTPAAVWQRLTGAALWCCSAGFMVWAYTLPR